MTTEQRIAAARIISDMIKADNIIEESEIRDMKELMSKYVLTSDHMSEARKIKFSDAVSSLQELSHPKRKEFFDSIYHLAMSDNVCVPREALLLIALKYCLVEFDRLDADGRKLPKPYLISCLSGEATMSDMYMVYLESSYNEQYNKDICRDFELLVTQSRLNGFNFIYIPKMVEEFKAMNREYVLNVISYMAPNLKEDVIQGVYDRLCRMTTVEFFHNVLYEKLKVQALHDAPPSLLINIGTSVVPYCAADGSVQYYTEFLCIPLHNSMLDMVREILHFYKTKVNIRTINITDNEGQFKYFGFYKALFDFLIAPPPVEPDLIFLGQDIKKRNKYHIALRYANGQEKKIYLTPNRYNLYYDIVRSTYNTPLKGLAVAKVDKTSVSHLRTDIRNEMFDVAFVNQYLPERNGNIYSILLDRKKVFVRKYDYPNNTFEDIPIAKM